MMERSSRFLSLSGFSGVWVGLLAIAYMVWVTQVLGYDFMDGNVITLLSLEGQYLMIGSACLLMLSIFSSMVMTIRKTRIRKQKIWTKSTKELMLSLMLPLFCGAGMIWLDAYDYFLNSFYQITLYCYGLALFFASRYTYDELRYFGALQILLGVLASIFQDYVLVFWILGFGLLHILYGVQMYFKYER